MQFSRTARVLSRSLVPAWATVFAAVGCQSILPSGLQTGPELLVSPEPAVEVSVQQTLDAAAGAAPGTTPATTYAGPAAIPAQLVATDVSWKERLEQPYVYLEVFGDYRDVGSAMRSMLERARLAGVEPGGPPFVLYFDDPASVPVERLRARACLPIATRIGSVPGLSADLLPRAMVAYTRVRGPYPELPRVYPGLFAYLADHGWVPAGPLREIYQTDPGSVQTWNELESELQLPWTTAGS